MTIAKFVSGLLSSKLRDKGKMKVCHVAIVCSLTALLTILDLPLGSCDDVILQKRVSTDGGEETLIRPVLTTDVLVWIDPLEEHFKGNSIHVRSQKEYDLLWYTVLVVVLAPRQGSVPDQNNYNLWFKLVIHDQYPAGFFFQLYMIFRNADLKLTGRVSRTEYHGYLATL